MELSSRDARNWQLALALGAAVLAVVVGLLTALARTVEQIRAEVAEIWRVGKLVANNTIHIPLLAGTNQTLARINAAAGRIAAASGRIRAAVSRDQAGG